MGSDNDTELLGELQGLIKLFVADTEGAFVSEKNFKTAVAALHNFLKITFRFRIIAGDAHVEGEIARALTLRFVHPQLECLHRLFAARRTNHLDERRCSAD